MTMTTCAATSDATRSAIRHIQTSLSTRKGRSRTSFHKLKGTLADLAGAFGEERSITLCRELTKLHEEIFKTTIGGAMARYAEEAPRGEFVLVMAGASPEETEETPPTLEEAVAIAEESDFLHKVLPEELSRRYFAEERARCEALRAAADPAEYERIHYFNAI